MRFTVFIFIILLTQVTAYNYYERASELMKQITGISTKSVIKQLVDIWYEHTGVKTLSVAVYGKTGVGKSTLINNLFGQNVAETGDQYATTKNVEHYSKVINGILVHFYDTPGLSDDKNNDLEYLREMIPVLDKCDIVLICMTAFDTRIRDEDLRLLKILKNEFGNIIYYRAILVFTFANEVPHERLEKRISALIPHIKAITNHRVPIMPAELYKGKWLVNLWAVIFQRTDEKSNSALAKLTFDNLYDEVIKDKESSKIIGNKIMEDPTVPHQIKEKIVAKAKEHGCFASHTIVQLQNGEEKQVKNLKKGDLVQTGPGEYSPVIYLYNHEDLFSVYRYKGVFLTIDHLVYLNETYYPIQKLTNERVPIWDVTQVWTRNGHIMINNVIFSVYTGNHHIKHALVSSGQFILDRFWS